LKKMTVLIPGPSWVAKSSISKMNVEGALSCILQVLFSSIYYLVLNAFAKLDEEGAKAGNADDQVAVLIGIFLRILQHCAVNHIELKLKTEIKNVLQVLFPELSKHTNVFTKTMLRLLLKAPGCFPIMKMKTQQIARFFDKTRGNKIQISPRELKSLAKNSIGIKDDSLETVLILKIKRLIFIIEQIDDIKEHLKIYVKENLQQNFDIITSINGIGKTTAEKFLIEIADIENFKSHKQLRAYIGTDPSIKQSGSSVNVNGRISKRGNAYLRKTIRQMAVGVIRCCPYFADYFHKKISEGKKYKQAVIAVANKLIKTLYAMLKNKTFSQVKNEANLINIIYS